MFPVVHIQVWVRRVYLQHGVKIVRGDTVVDVGANIGLFSLLALNEGAGVVVAIEPIPNIAKVLELNLSRFHESGDPCLSPLSQSPLLMDGPVDGGATAKGLDVNITTTSRTPQHPHERTIDDRVALDSELWEGVTSEDRPECLSPPPPTDARDDASRSTVATTHIHSHDWCGVERFTQTHHVVCAAVGKAQQEDVLFTYYSDCPGESTRYPDERLAQRKRLRDALRNAITTPTETTETIEIMRTELAKLDSEIGDGQHQEKQMVCPVLPLGTILERCRLNSEKDVDLLKV